MLVATLGKIYLIDNAPVAAKDLHCCRWIEPRQFLSAMHPSRLSRQERKTQMTVKAHTVEKESGDAH